MRRPPRTTHGSESLNEGTPALRLDDVYVPFGAGPGLRELTLAVGAGECMAIVGASGAGKTTLLRAIAGLSPMTAGRIEIAGRDVTHLPAERRGAAYLHQTPVLFQHLDVFGNVAFPLRLRPRAHVDVAARVDEALRQMRIEALAGRSTAALSGGQRHRVALARALVADTPLLLLDEPFAALDPALRGEVRDAVIEVRETSGRALLLVTHDLDDAAMIADRICVLINGAIAQIATPSTLLDRPASLEVARFLGVPTMVRGRVRAGSFECALGAWPVRDVSAGDCTAVFWPAALRPASSGIDAIVLEVRRLPRGTTLILEAAGVRLEGAAPEAVPSAGDHLALDLRHHSIHYLPDP
jgi:putative spermidine/putrescine transport system ATP-binding protein